MQDDFLRIWGLAQQKPFGSDFSFLNATAKHQPQRALDDEETADDDRHHQHEGAGIHPPPRRDVGVLEQNHETDGRAHQSAHRLKGERPEHHSATNAAWSAFGNDQVGSGIIAPERDTDADEGCHHEGIGGTQRQQHRENAKKHHLDDEHLLSAVAIGQPTERHGPDQNAEQRGGGDDALLGGAQGELFRHQRQRHTGGEDHHAFEKLAGGSEPPDEPLHIGDWGMSDWCRIRPDRRLVDVALDGVVLDAPAGSFTRDRRRAFRGHGWSRIYSPEIREDGVDGKPPRQIVLPIAGSATRAFTPAFDGLGDRARFARA